MAQDLCFNPHQIESTCQPESLPIRGQRLQPAQAPKHDFVGFLVAISWRCLLMEARNC